jgi:hypothetical protein
LIEFRKIESLTPLKEPTVMIRMFCILLKGQGMSYFEHHSKERLGAGDSEFPENELIEQELRDIGL